MVQPGDIFFSNFPKFVQRENAADYNIDSKKPNARPRPVVVLEEITPNRLFVAPITGDASGMNLSFPTFVPLKEKDYPGVLSKDSFIKLNQNQSIDIKWIVDNQKVGQLTPKDLDRTRHFSLYASQTEKAYSEWISEIVAKNVKVNRPDIERQVLDELNLPTRKFYRQPPIDLKRSDIVPCHFQPEILNQSKERIHGNHLGIVIVEGNIRQSPPGQSIVVPVVENKSDYVHLYSPKDVGVTINGQARRVLLSQMQPMNWSWMELDKKVGQVMKQQMLDVDRAVIDTLGLKPEVIKKSRSLISEQLMKNRGPKTR
ncbi:hypothetical protein BK126_26575 [Paenibacillus sp. FSL H7-0326]|uniref:type II toxin-antitoxin system PemK/MazF family toxin n=1 Tax=Paenibacillus sp. FSL H7-0326 TaxID=1921144 RepID=UPI00096F06C1|nr:type II toxin-antitoxin system PemK/MazF family toxin [Paenibacillus sp. FSL H7-0326]OMC63761.1 hypothetical protein BK126_26575 [Paenibacillus sp. FSL H7-0326]